MYNVETVREEIRKYQAFLKLMNPDIDNSAEYYMTLSHYEQAKTDLAIAKINVKWSRNNAYNAQNEFSKASEKHINSEWLRTYHKEKANEKSLEADIALQGWSAATDSYSSASDDVHSYSNKLSKMTLQFKKHEINAINIVSELCEDFPHYGIGYLCAADLNNQLVLFYVNLWVEISKKWKDDLEDAYDSSTQKFFRSQIEEIKKLALNFDNEFEHVNQFLTEDEKARFASLYKTVQDMRVEAQSAIEKLAKIEAEFEIVRAEARKKQEEYLKKEKAKEENRTNALIGVLIALGLGLFVLICLYFNGVIGCY